MFQDSLLVALVLLLYLPKTLYMDCEISEYGGVNGTVLLSGYNLHKSCPIHIRVPVSRRAVLEIKKLKVMGRMPNCENGSLEIRVG